MQIASYRVSLVHERVLFGHYSLRLPPLIRRLRVTALTFTGRRSRMIGFTERGCVLATRNGRKALLKAAVQRSNGAAVMTDSLKMGR